MFVSSSLKFCVKFERKPAFNVKCLQFWHIFCEATRVKPWQNTFIDRDKNTEILKRIRLNSRNRKILVISKFLPKKLWNFWYFLVRSSDLYFDIASAILVFTVVRSAFCILLPLLCRQPSNRCEQCFSSKSNCQPLIKENLETHEKKSGDSTKNSEILFFSRSRLNKPLFHRRKSLTVYLNVTLLYLCSLL